MPIDQVFCNPLRDGAGRGTVSASKKGDVGLILLSANCCSLHSKRDLMYST